MKQHEIDAYIVTDSDPHASEYTAMHWKARTWVSGFSGSNGTMVVTMSEALLWTDGRYYIQAENQMQGTGIILMRSGEPETVNHQQWLLEHVKQFGCIGFNGKVFSAAEYLSLTNIVKQKEIRVVTEYDLIQQLWTQDRPPLPDDVIFCHEMKYAGVTAKEKINDVRIGMKRQNAEYALISGLEDICWLMNFRGNDIPYLPVAYAFAFISDKEAHLYIESHKIPEEMKDAFMLDGISVFELDAITKTLQALPEGTSLLYDANKTNCWLYSALAKGIRKLPDEELTVKLKALKNPVEIQNYRECQIRDGVAMVRFLIWLEKEIEVKDGLLKEWDVVCKIKELRAKVLHNRGESFGTIVGYGPNGAMMHYAPTEKDCSALYNKGLMVVDSGGQYLDGTTDITRTIAFKECTAEEKKDFTLTLKAHISLASARFLYGATGQQIDVVARKIMWDEGLDYKSGTGHGVGYFLGVHEGPQSISMRAQNTARLEENMIVSIEPGVYKEGKHGVRIENIARICEDFCNECGRFMKFEILSLCPISFSGIDIALLDEKEKLWLNAYHKKVFELLSPFLDEAEAAWLKRSTKAIA